MRAVTWILGSMIVLLTVCLLIVGSYLYLGVRS